MSFVHADRVKETTTTTGLGTYSLAGAAAGFRTFVAGVGSGNRCTYCVENGTDWEINEGVVTDAAPDTLTRARLLSSSTGSAINWGAGTKNIFSVYAAAATNPLVKALANGYSNNTTTGTEVGGLSVDLEPGTYMFEYALIMQSAATGTGIGLGVNFTGTAPTLVLNEHYVGTGTTASTGIIDDTNTGAGAEQIVEGAASRAFSTTFPDLNVITGVIAANANHLIRVIGVIVVTVAGQLELWANSEVAASTIQLMAGSSVRVTRTN